MPPERSAGRETPPRLAAFQCISSNRSRAAESRLYKPIDESDRIDDWLYLPETLYAFVLIIVVSVGAGPYSLDGLILALMNKHIA